MANHRFLVGIILIVIILGGLILKEINADFGLYKDGIFNKNSKNSLNKNNRSTVWVCEEVKEKYFNQNFYSKNFQNSISLKNISEQKIENILKNIENILISLTLAQTDNVNYWVCSQDNQKYYNYNVCLETCMFGTCVPYKEAPKPPPKPAPPPSEPINRATTTSSYSANYFGSCNGLYCYNGPGGHHVCADYEYSLREGMAFLTALRYEILYQKHRMIAEKEDLLLEISRLKLEIEYYQKHIEQEKKILEQIQDPNAREYQEAIIAGFEEKKAEKEKEKELREKLLPHFDELATKDQNSLIDQMAENVKSAVEQIEKCLIEGVKECKPSCRGGCHDTLGCFPVSCGGGKPTVCGLGYHYSKAYFINRKIISEVNEILKILGAPTLPEEGYATTTAPTTTDQQVREELQKAGINVNKACQDSTICKPSGGPINQTCVNGLQPSTIEGVKTIKQNCNCDVTITGGTECGHAQGTYSHENGYKLDLRPNQNLDNYIQRQGCGKQLYVKCKGKDGNVYYYEGDHWDVCFSCPT